MFRIYAPAWKAVTAGLIDDGMHDFPPPIFATKGSRVVEGHLMSSGSMPVCGHIVTTVLVRQETAHDEKTTERIPSPTRPKSTNKV